MAALKTRRDGLGRTLRQLLPWGRPLPPPDRQRDGPRIGVVGNCQARGVARSLSILLPRARVELIPIGRLARDRLGSKGLADALRSYDHVFSQPFPPGPRSEGGSDEVVTLLPGVRLFPALVFIAFHPDQIYAGDIGPKRRTPLLPSPLHTYHSAIALFGHLRGLDALRIAALFREETFAALGYLDLWQGAADDLLDTGRAIGFELGPDFLRWSRRGAFMHAINHPRLFVLADIAARLAREAGLTAASVAVEDYLGDDLLDDVIWPVYPPVAALYGLPGSYQFKRRSTPGAVPSLIDVEGLIVESLAIYRATPLARLRSHRTDHWDGIPEIRALFDAA